VAVKLNTGDPPELEFINAAVQFPLMVPLFELFPHPASIIAIPSTIIVPSVFIILQVVIEFRSKKSECRISVFTSAF
jgi:hypothetical protein